MITPGKVYSCLPKDKTNRKKNKRSRLWLFPKQFDIEGIKLRCHVCKKPVDGRYRGVFEHELVVVGDVSYFVLHDRCREIIQTAPPLSWNRNVRNSRN